jgi:nucleotidyltransferase/DNA polymerase involved in DNA repair
MKNPDQATVARLEELPNIGKAMAAELRLIGIEHPQQLIGREAFALYKMLCAKSGDRHNPCVIGNISW